MSRLSFPRLLLVCVTAVGLLPVAAVAQEPRAEFTLVKHEQRAIRNGQEGLLITCNARLTNLQDQQVRFSAYFDFNKKPLMAIGQRYRAPYGTLTVQVAETPKQQVANVTGVQLFLPYDELDLSKRAPNEVTFYIELQLAQQGKAKLLASSGNFFFTYPPSEPAPVVASGVSGRWTGTEDFQGYGDLVFEFEPAGVSFMTDKDGRRQGTWTQQGSDVTVAFYNGTVVYRAAVSGTTMSGTATNGKTTWNWRASSTSGGAAPTPPPIAAGVLGRWAGTEDLKGYGDLVMEIQQNGVVFMTDKDGRRQGVWEQHGNNVALGFYNGSVVYQGVLTGSTIAGTAASGAMNWNWRATKQGGTPVVAPPTPNPPSPTPPPPTKISPFGRWVGNEELQGYGDLVMEIEQNGIVFMTDKDGRRQGSWNQESNMVTLMFYDGAVVYRGNLTETNVAGAATSGSRTWKWQATREGVRPTVQTPPTPTAPQPPVPPTAPPSAPVAGILGRWTGNEDLQGYGDLVMEVEQNGVVFMTDKDGRRQGAWTQQNNEFALAFYNGTVVYRGALSGATLSGVATNGKTQWNWRIARSGQDASPPIRGATIGNLSAGADGPAKPTTTLDLPMTNALRSSGLGSKPNALPAPDKFVGKFDAPQPSKYIPLTAVRRTGA
jgi:hypothetical protein